MFTTCLRDYCYLHAPRSNSLHRLARSLRQLAVELWASLGSCSSSSGSLSGSSSCLRFCSSSECWTFSGDTQCAVQRQVTGQGSWLRRGVHRHTSVYEASVKNFLSWVSCSRCSRLEILCIVSLWPCIWQLRFLFLGVACGVRKIGFFGRFAVFRAQCSAPQWIHVLHQYLALLDEFCTFFAVKWTRSLRCSVSILTQNGEVCFADASALSAGMRARTWKSGHDFYEAHVAGSGDDGGSVRRHWPM